MRGRRELDPEDDRPPICPACGVTMGIVAGADGESTSYVCLECGFSEESTAANDA